VISLPECLNLTWLQRFRRDEAREGVIKSLRVDAKDFYWFPMTAVVRSGSQPVDGASARH
jgi:hypothetical protein